MVLPTICATFKGVPPHVFAEAWLDPEHGQSRMIIDMATAAEINAQINEAHEKANKTRGGQKSVKGGAAKAVARRNQRREQMRKGGN